MRHTFTFTEDERRALQHERFHHPHPLVQRKMEVAWLKAQGVSQVEIARLTGLGRRTVVRYLHDYAVGGLAALRQATVRQPRGELQQHVGELEDYFLEHPAAIGGSSPTGNRAFDGRQARPDPSASVFKKVSGCVAGK